MQIKRTDIYKDGGSLSIETDCGKFVVNRRIGDEANHGKITMGYNGNDVGQVIAQTLYDILKTVPVAYYEVSWYRERIAKYYELSDTTQLDINLQYTVVEKHGEDCYKLVRGNKLRPEILESVSISKELATLLCIKNIDICKPL